MGRFHQDNYAPLAPPAQTFLLLYFFLSELHWHLSGPSEVPLEQRFLVLFANEPFPSF